MRHRDTHYFLWFIFFGLLSGVIYYLNHHNTVDSESTWLLVTGLLGLLFGARWLANGRLSRPYDLVIGLIFALAGLIGIAQGFHVNPLSGAPAALSGFISATTFFGLSLTVLPSLVHAVLGISSLNHALRDK